MKNWLIFLVLFIASPAWAQVTVVETQQPANGVNSTDGQSVTGLTSGNGLVILFVWDSSTSAGTISLTGETLTLVGTALSGSTNCCGTSTVHMGYVKQLSSGGSKTITSTLNVTWKVWVIEVSGQDTTTFLDTSCTGTGSGFTYSCSLTTANASELIATVSRGELNISPDTGYTRLPGSGTNIDSAATYDANVGAAGSKTAQVTSSNTGAWLFKAAAFIPVAAPAPPTVRHRVIQ